MTLRGRLWCASMAAAACLMSSASRAQFSYDVPYVPTPHVVVEEMLRLANVKSDDFVMDLGSGDGRILIAAVRKFGARGVGVDLDPDRIAESDYNAQLQGVSGRPAVLGLRLRDHRGQQLVARAVRPEPLEQHARTKGGVCHQQLSRCL